MDKNWQLLMSPHHRQYYSNFILLLKENKSAHNRKFMEILYFVYAKKFDLFLALVLLKFDLFFLKCNEPLFFNNCPLKTKFGVGACKYFH